MRPHPVIDRILELSGPMPYRWALRRYLERLKPALLQARLEVENDPDNEKPIVSCHDGRAVQAGQHNDLATPPRALPSRPDSPWAGLVSEPASAWLAGRASAPAPC